MEFLGFLVNSMILTEDMIRKVKRKCLGAIESFFGAEVSWPPLYNQPFQLPSLPSLTTIKKQGILFQSVMQLAGSTLPSSTRGTRFVATQPRDIEL